MRLAHGLAVLLLALLAEDPAPTRLTPEVAKRSVEQVIPEVEAIRGLKFKRTVPVAVVDDATARKYALERLHRFIPDDEIRAQQKAYGLLGVMPVQTDMMQQYLDVLGEQAGGFYDPGTKSFFLLDDMPASLVSVLTSHELTHALEDQHYDLDARLTQSLGNDDLVFARSAVHEGSATLVMGLYVTRAMTQGTLRMEDLQAVADSEVGRGEKLSAMPPALRRPLLGTYILGAVFLLRGNPGNLQSVGFPVQDSIRAWSDGPLSSEQILHPEKYWDPTKRDDPKKVDLGRAGKALGNRWRLSGTGVLGELLLGVLVGAPSPSGALGLGTPEIGEWTNAAASGWGGDRWELWTQGDAAVAVLETVWDTPEDAEEFAGALPQSRPGFVWRRRSDRVAIVAGDAGRKTDALLKLLLESPGGRIKYSGPKRVAHAQLLWQHPAPSCILS